MYPLTARYAVPLITVQAIWLIDSLYNEFGRLLGSMVEKLMIEEAEFDKVVANVFCLLSKVPASLLREYVIIKSESPVKKLFPRIAMYPCVPSNGVRIVFVESYLSIGFGFFLSCACSK